jgi:hypothetical protein
MVLHSRYQQGQSSPAGTEDRQMFIDENTSREDLLTVIYTEGNMIDVCIERGFEPETASDADLLSFIREWIEAGNEAA